MGNYQVQYYNLAGDLVQTYVNGLVPPVGAQIKFIQVPSGVEVTGQVQSVHYDTTINVTQLTAVVQLSV